MPSPYDICICGDYRRDHEGGTGPCTFPPERIAGHEPCRAFRLHLRSQSTNSARAIPVPRKGPDGGNVVRHDSTPTKGPVKI